MSQFVIRFPLTEFFGDAAIHHPTGGATEGGPYAALVETLDVALSEQDHDGDVPTVTVGRVNWVANQQGVQPSATLPDVARQAFLSLFFPAEWSSDTSDALSTILAKGMAEAYDHVMVTFTSDADLDQLNAAAEEMHLPPVGGW